MPTVYLAGGCYWGVQTYYDRVQGVTSTVAGFAQSRIPRPTGEQIASGEAGAVETVAVAYDSQQVSLQTLARLHALLIQETPADEKHPFQSMPVSIGLIQNRGMHSKPPFVSETLLM